jgi:pimeloyl-ACP methyl ester carboxylesterase
VTITWRMNTFRIPIEWINFPDDPGDGQAVVPKDNIVQIEIDTANSDEVWCTSIDWAMLRIKVARPVIFVHGILSGPGTWSQGASWIGTLEGFGLPRKAINLGFLPNLIQLNAGMIAQEVAAARRRWGVDKVNLVCHSKGGLDARHFVERDDSVEKVIQIGTPNAGSRWADHIIRGSLRLPPLLGFGINLLALATAPGGYQLTEVHMELYNRTHDHNRNVKYTAVAGDYSVGCESFACSLIERFIGFVILGGPNDVVVAVNSVHALGYTQNFVFETSGLDFDAIHIFQTGSRRIIEGLSGHVKEFGTARHRAATTAGFVPFASTASAAGTIRQGQVRTHTIPIDQSSPSFFTLAYPSGNLDLALISPSGQRLDSKTIAGNPNVARSLPSQLPRSASGL